MVLGKSLQPSDTGFAVSPPLSVAEPYSTYGSSSERWVLVVAGG